MHSRTHGRSGKPSVPPKTKNVELVEHNPTVQSSHARTDGNPLQIPRQIRRGASLPAYSQLTPAGSGRPAGDRVTDTVRIPPRVKGGVDCDRSDANRAQSAEFPPKLPRNYPRVTKPIPDLTMREGVCLYTTRAEWDAPLADARYPINATGPFGGPTAEEKAAAEPYARPKEPG